MIFPVNMEVGPLFQIGQVQIEIALLLQIGQITFAALVAVVPPFYPRKSLFVLRAKKGIDRLREPREGRKDEEMSMGWIDRGEKEFKPLLHGIKHRYPLQKQVERIGLAYGDPNSLSDYIDFDTGACVGNNAVLYVEYEDEEREAIIYHPFDPKHTLRLSELSRWVQNVATYRSNYFAAGLAIVWTALAIASTI